jgi:hypothetical protein
MKKKRRKAKRARNFILAWVQENDPTRLRTRTVQPEKGSGRKDRPRDNKIDDSFDCAA